MEKIEFKNKLMQILKKNNIHIQERKLKDEKIEKLYKYMKYILEINNNINVTAIKDENDFIVKHIIDSIYIDQFLDIYCKKDKLINFLDIGTGGGFPLVPIQILNEDNIIATGLDSIYKKLNIVKKFSSNINILHGRCEQLAHIDKYREKYDVVTSRAVAEINKVIEYMVGFVKIGGILIIMKGKLENLDKTLLTKFGLETIKIEEYKINELNRSIYIFRKRSKLKNIYPNKNSNFYKISNE